MAMQVYKLKAKKNKNKKAQRQNVYKEIFFP